MGAGGGCWRKIYVSHFPPDKKWFLIVKSEFQDDVIETRTGEIGLICKFQNDCASFDLIKYYE